MPRERVDIVIMDDDDVLLRTARERFVREGLPAKILLVERKDNAADLAKEAAAGRLILSDFNMKDITANDVVDEILKLEQTEDRPILLRRNDLELMRKDHKDSEGRDDVEGLNAAFQANQQSVFVVATGGGMLGREENKLIDFLDQGVVTAVVDKPYQNAVRDAIRDIRDRVNLAATLDTLARRENKFNLRRR